MNLVNFKNIKNMELSNFLYGNIYLYHMKNNIINTNIENTNIYVDLSDEEFLSIINTYNLPAFITQSIYAIERLQDINNKNE